MVLDLVAGVCRSLQKAAGHVDPAWCCCLGDWPFSAPLPLPLCSGCGARRRQCGPVAVKGKQAGVGDKAKRRSKQVSECRSVVEVAAASAA